MIHYDDDAKILNSFTYSQRLDTHTRLLFALFAVVFLQLQMCENAVAAIFDQVAIISPDDRAPQDEFGRDISLSGKRVLISAPFDDSGGTDDGSAYIFEKDASGDWVEIVELTTPITQGRAEFGKAVSLDEDMALIGGFEGWPPLGSAFLYKRSLNGVWENVAQLRSNDNTGYDWFGTSLSLSGGSALVGAYGNDDAGSQSGSAYIFKEDGVGAWHQTAKLTADDAIPHSRFGYSTALEGNLAAIGAVDDKFYSDRDTGSVYLFREDGVGNWTQIANVVADDAVEFSEFGADISVNNGRLLVGASNIGDGAAYLFEEDAFGDWNQTHKFVPNDADGNRELFGSSVSLFGNLALIGTPGDDENSTDSGASYLFQEDTTGNWTQIAKLSPTFPSSSEFFAQSVALGDGIALIGSPTGSISGAYAAGKVYEFEVPIQIPEPSSLLLSLIGMSSILGIIRRQSLS